MAIALEDWDQLVADLRNIMNADRACAAAERLHTESGVEEIPRLIGLLADSEAFVREAAAWPLTKLAGLTALRELLQAFQRGLDEGFDNDGFTAALIDLVQSDPSSARTALQHLAGSSDPVLRINAEWLLEFC